MSADQDRPFVRYRRRRELLSVEDEPRLLDQIVFAASQRWTQEMTAAMLGVSGATFSRFLDNNEEARHAWEDGQQKCKIAVSNLVWMHAKHDPSTVRFMAKNILGMTDGKENSVVVNNQTNIVNATVTMNPLQARQRIAELSRKLKTPSRTAIDGTALVKSSNT